MHLLSSRDKALHDQLLADWIASGENWLLSSVYLKSLHVKTQRRRGKHVMVEYRVLKEKYGAASAKTVRDNKRTLEENKPATDSVVYWMKHPELPNVEDW